MFSYKECSSAWLRTRAAALTLVVVRGPLRLTLLDEGSCALHQVRVLGVLVDREPGSERAKRAGEDVPVFVSSQDNAISVHGSAAQQRIFAAFVRMIDPASAPVAVSRPGVVQHPLPGMTEGYTEHFVGRRRELRALLPALREALADAAVKTKV